MQTRSASDHFYVNEIPHLIKIKKEKKRATDNGISNTNDKAEC